MTDYTQIMNAGLRDRGHNYILRAIIYLAFVIIWWKDKLGTVEINTKYKLQQIELGKTTIIHDRVWFCQLFF